MTLRHERHLLKGPERRELTMTTVRIIGPGRAGRSFALAFKLLVSRSGIFSGAPMTSLQPLSVPTC